MPPKRAASKTSAVKPATKVTIPQPLIKALAILPPVALAELFTDHVLPGLKDKSCKGAVEATIADMLAKDPAGQIGFKAHKKALVALSKQLKESLRRAWKHEYDEQMEFMGSMVCEVGSWLNDLFKVAVEAGAQLEVVQQCLMEMEAHMLEIMHNHCRMPFGQNLADNDEYYDCTITDSHDNLRYIGRPDVVIPRFWRDLLLMAISAGGSNKGVLDAFQRHRKNSNTKRDIRANAYGHSYEIPTTLTGVINNNNNNNSTTASIC